MLSEKSIESKGNKASLVGRWKNNSIPTTYKVRERTVEGFEASPIGMLQYVAKRGLIDTTKLIDDYNLKSHSHDDEGNNIPGTCLYDIWKYNLILL